MPGQTRRSKPQWKITMSPPFQMAVLQAIPMKRNNTMRLQLILIAAITCSTFIIISSTFERRPQEESITAEMLKRFKLGMDEEHEADGEAYELQQNQQHEKPRFIIHVGPRKTGTTTIQGALFKTHQHRGRYFDSTLRGDRYKMILTTWADG